MKRSAADNEYLHKDFHGALSRAVEYLSRRYGEQAVKDYLRQFALAYYAPLRETIRRRGLAALKEHFERIYRMEGGQVRIDMSDDEMVLRVPACPAVTHMRKNGYFVAEMFHETTGTVNEAICEGTDFAAELVEYDPQTGRSVQRFFRRAS
jgi:hypothetical protein